MFFPLFNKNKKSDALEAYASELLINKAVGLPTMPPREVQMKFTGKCDWDTMRQAIDFLKIVELGYQQIMGRSLDRARILDFGFGWGRMLRLLPFYTDQIYGCDPLGAALDLCKRHNVPGDLRLSDFVPTSLPFPDESMDIVLAYSVFTHTSLDATLSSLNAIRKVIVPSGVVALTVRPRKFWLHLQNQFNDAMLSSVLDNHDSHGFSFIPHKGHPAYPHFGNTTIAPDWIKASFPNLHVKLSNRNLEDPYQQLVFLYPPQQ